MLNNFQFLYNKDKNNFNDMLLNELLDPNLISKQNENGQTVLHYLIEKNDTSCINNVLNFKSFKKERSMLHHYFLNS